MPATRILRRRVPLAVPSSDNCYLVCDPGHKNATVLPHTADRAGIRSLKRHLTVAEIEQYVTRSGSVDEIIAIAEHLEACFECRDRAVAIVDPGTAAHELRVAELPRERRPAMTTSVVVMCIAIVVIVIAILVFVLGLK